MKKISFGSHIRVGNGGQAIDHYALRQRASADPESFVGRLIDLADAGKWSWSDIRSLRDLYHSLADIQVNGHVSIHGRAAPITTGAFPLVTGALTVAGVNEAYEAVPTIGQDLVTDFASNKKDVTFTGVLSQAPANERVEEGMDFPLVGAGQERFDIGSNRRGLRMQITQEMIEENDLPEVLSRVQALGEIPAESIEELTLRRVTDFDGSAASAAEPYVLHLDKTATTLYTTTANSPGTRAPSGTRLNNNALVDSTDLDAARELLAGMLNSRGKRIAMPVSEMILLVPDALLSEATKILGSELEPGVLNEANPWGPRGIWRPSLRSTSKLDADSTTAWYLGAFPKQFRRKRKIDMEMVSLLGTDTQAYLRQRIAAEMRVAWDVEVGAVDYVYVCQSLSGTTSPKDD